MPKPSRVRYSGSSPFIDDTQANRIQALGSSSRLTTEDIKELGTLNIAEIIDDVPQVDISIDANETGTSELVSLLSNTGYGCQVVAVPTTGTIGSLQLRVKPGSYLAKGTHRTNFAGATLTCPSSGNQMVYLQPDITGASSLAGIGTSVPTGAIKIADITISGTVSAVTQSMITDRRPFFETKETDFESASVDIFVPVKQGASSAVDRTMYMEKAFVNNMDFSFQVNGLATASYRLETDNKRWFLNNSAHINVDEFKYTSGTISLVNTPTTLANGNKILKLTKNGVDLIEGTNFTISGKVITFTSSAPVAGDLIKVRYASTVGSEFLTSLTPTDETHPEIAGGIKEGQVEIYLVDANGTADASRTTRVQSARFSIPLTREPIDELGSLAPYDRPLTLPITNSVSLEIKDSDLELMARFAGYSSLTGVNEIALDDLVKNKGVLVKIYRESDVKRAKLSAGHPDKYAIKTIYVKNLIPQSESWDVRIDSDASQTFEFQAHNFTISDKYTL